VQLVGIQLTCGYRKAPPYCNRLQQLLKFTAVTASDCGRRLLADQRGIHALRRQVYRRPDDER